MENIFTVKLYNFKCYTEKIFTFKPGLTLLHGKSGTGKSTIFQAVLWCLYGTIRGFKPRGCTNAQTVVVLEIGDIAIGRRNSPKELRLYRANYISLLDEEAQEWINIHFGDESYFITSSYVAQGERCLLLEGKNSEKVELLNSIIYGSPKGTQSEYFISNLKPKITELEYQLTQYNAIRERLSAEIAKESKNIKIAFKINVGDLKKTLEEENRNYKELLLKKGEQKMLLARIEELKNRPKCTLPSNIPDISCLEKELQENYELSKRSIAASERKAMFKIYADRVKTLNPITGVSKEFTNEEIQRTKREEERYNYVKSILDKYSISYTEEALSTVKEKISEFMKIYPYIEYYREFQEINSRASKTSEYLIDHSSEISALNKELYFLRETATYKKCPYCGKNVVVTMHELKKPKTETDVVSTGRIDEIEEKLRKLEVNQQVYEKWKYLKSKLSDVMESPFLKTAIEMPKHKVSELFGMGSILSGMTIVKCPESHQRMIDTNKYIEYTNQMKKLEEEKSGLHDVDYISKIKTLTLQISETRELKDKFEKSKKDEMELEKISAKIDDELDLKIESKGRSIKEISSLIEQAIAYERVCELKKELRNTESYINSLNLKLSTSNNLLSLIIKAEAMTYESALLNINSLLKEIISEIFDEPTTVEIDTVAKNKFNTTITSSGSEVSKIGLMSGGEADRISLALVLSLNILNTGSPFLFIDESISSLDLELKEKCISVLRKYTRNGSFIIVVNHEAIEGSYDDVVDVK